jgi:hypothetical protein
MSHPSLKLNLLPPWPAHPYSPNQHHHPLLKTLIFILILTVHARSEHANSQNCFLITSSTTFSSCSYCQTSTSIVCNHTSPNGTVTQLSPADCASECCNSNLYDNTNQYPLCYTQDNSSTASNLSLATVLIIIFFSIPAGLCLLIAICTCISNHRRTQEARPDQQLSAVNLAEFNLEDLGPLYQDRTQSCSICLEADCNLRTKCGHLYHSQCLSAWIHKK